MRATMTYFLIVLAVVVAVPAISLAAGFELHTSSVIVGYIAGKLLSVAYFALVHEGARP